MTILTLKANDSNVSITKVVMKIDEKKPFPSGSGNSYSTTYSISDSNENVYGKVNGYVFKETDGLIAFDPVNPKSAKGSVVLSMERNPGLLSLFTALDAAGAIEFARVGFEQAKPYVSEGGASKKDPTKTYGPAAFLQVMIAPNNTCCGTCIQYLDDSGDTPVVRYLTSETEMRKGTEDFVIKGYVEEHGGNASVIKFIQDVYGCQIKYDKKLKEATVIIPPAGLKTTKRLLSPKEFNEAVKDFTVKQIKCDHKPIYVDAKGTFKTLRVTSMFLVRREEFDDGTNEFNDGLEVYTNVKSARKVAPIETVDPDDIPNPDDI